MASPHHHTTHEHSSPTSTTKTHRVKSLKKLSVTLFLFLTALAGCKNTSQPSKGPFVVPDNSGAWLCNAAELGMSVDPGVKRVLYDCPRGFVNDEQTGHCCVPGKTYSEEQGTCVGEPECPAIFETKNVYGEDYCAYSNASDPVAWFMEGCQAGNLDDCSSAGSMLAGFDFVPADFDRARELYEHACNERLLSACSNLANLHMRNSGIVQDKDLAVELNQKICAVGSPSGCYQMGYITEAWQKNPKESIPYYRRGCDGGDWRSCHAIKRLTLERDATLAQIREFTTSHLEQCEERDMRGCDFYLDDLERHGVETTPAGRRRALEIVEATCADFPMFSGCIEVVTGLGDGMAMFSRLEDRFDSVCHDDNNYTMCEKLGILGFKTRPRGGTQEKREARRASYEAALQKACEDGRRPRACWFLANSHHNAAKEGIAGRAARKVEALKRACGYGYYGTCGHLGEALYDPGSTGAIQAARAAFKRGCDGNNVEACSLLAGVLTKHPEVFELTREQANAAALPLHRKACHELEQPDACEATSTLLLSREPAPSRREEDDALGYLVFACNKGSVSACHELLTRAPERGRAFFGLLRAGVSLTSRGGGDLEPLEASPLQDDSIFNHLSSAVKGCPTVKGSCVENKVRFYNLLRSAEEILKQECQGGNGASCGVLMQLVDEAFEPMTLDAKAAVALAGLGCEYRDFISCQWLSSNVYSRRWRGFFDRATTLDAANRALAARPADTSSARLLVAIALEQNLPLAELAVPLQKRCESLEKSNQACHASSREVVLPLARHNPVAARDFTGQQCKSFGHNGSCALYARAMFELDPSKINDHVPADCDPSKHHPTLCAERGWQLLQGEDSAREGAALLSSLCEAGNIDACQDLGAWLIAKPTLGEQSQGRELLQRACAADHALACYHLGLLYRDGTTKLDADEERAASTLEKSCGGFYRPACFELRGAPKENE